MNHKALLELNKTALYAKLDKLKKYKDIWVVNDIIDVLSNQKERDKRIVNDYSSDEVKTYSIKRPTGIKTVRMFTKAGLTRYLHDGKLYDYKNACEYFEVPAKNKVHEEYDAFLKSIQVDQNYKTTALLKWLFGKRKMCKALGDYTSLSSVIDMFSDDIDIEKTKFEYIKQLQDYHQKKSTPNQ